MIPFKYRKSGEGAVASFNWVDIADGAGYVMLYGTMTELVGGKTYKLLNEAVYSTDNYTLATMSTAGSYAKDIDLTFDTSVFNLPKTVKGDAVIYIPFALQADTGADGYFIVKLYKYSGSTATQIGSTMQSANENVGAANKAFKAVMTTTISKTNFKKGDKLRMVVEGWAKKGAGSNNIVLGHDPKGGATYVSTTNTIPADMFALIPFDIDL